MNNDYVKVKSSPQSISNIQFAELMAAVLSKKKPIRFQASGYSMSPIIHDGDIIIVSPVSNTLLDGKIVAVFNEDKSLFIHRVVKVTGEKILLKGDNSIEFDGWVSKNNILGVVTGIEHQTKKSYFGLGFERTLISYLSRQGWLIPIISNLIQIRNRIFNRLS